MTAIISAAAAEWQRPRAFVYLFPTFSGVDCRTGKGGRRLHVATNRLWLLALFAASFAVLPARAGGHGPGTGAVASEPGAAEAEVDSLIRGWFALLQTAPADPRLLATLVREPSFELSVADGSAPPAQQLLAWLEGLRASEPGAEFVIDSIRIEPEAKGMLRARFEVERRERTSDGALHLVRRHQTWWVRTRAGDPPSVIRIEQRPALPFPGTGPRIVCD